MSVIAEMLIEAVAAIAGPPEKPKRWPWQRRRRRKRKHRRAVRR